MDIEELVKKYAGEWGEYTQMAVESSIRAALTELAAEHALEMRAQDATIANLQERVRQLEAERVPVNAEENLSSMIIDWVDGGIKSGTDWRNGLQEVIGKRLERLAAAPAKEQTK